MANLIDLKTFSDERWNLTVVENDGSVIPFDIQRQFRIYWVNYEERGGHRHHITRQVAICLNGSCNVRTNNGEVREVFHLDSPAKGLILEPADFHFMYDFTKDAILMVFASHKYDPKDYIYDDYGNE